jgi:hypothetical protein
MIDDIVIDVNNISVSKKITNAKFDNASSGGRANR